MEPDPRPGPAPNVNFERGERRERRERGEQKERGEKKKRNKKKQTLRSDNCISSGALVLSISGLAGCGLRVALVVVFLVV